MCRYTKSYLQVYIPLGLRLLQKAPPDLVQIPTLKSCHCTALVAACCLFTGRWRGSKNPQCLLFKFKGRCPAQLCLKADHTVEVNDTLV